MNPQLKSRTDAVPQHPHATCALRDMNTLDPWLRTRSSDLTTHIGAHQPQNHERLERHKTHISPRSSPTKPIQHP
jgi:hypothetical protein